MLELGPGRLVDEKSPEVLIFPEAKFQPVGSCAKFLISVAGTNMVFSALILGIFLIFGSSRNAAALSPKLVELDGFAALKPEVPFQGKGFTFLGTTEVVLI